MDGHLRARHDAWDPLDGDAFTAEIGPDGGRVLRTLRGLGPLLEPAR